MDRQKVTDILNRIISIKGEIYDLSHSEEDSQTRGRLSRSLDLLEEVEKPLKETLCSFGEK